MKKKRPILITGCVRSGTTWTGTVIAEAPGVKYIHEPFFSSKRSSPIQYAFQCVGESSDPKLQKELLDYYDHLINDFSAFVNYNIGEFFVNGTYKRFLTRDFIRDKRYRIRNILRSPGATIPLLKDPIALLSAEWLYRNLQTRNVIIIRHPAAVAASFKVAGWGFDFSYFLDQPGFQDSSLAKYTSDIERFVAERQPVIEQASLLWCILTEMILEYYSKYLTDWYFVRHEDLSADPESEFKKLYDFLELPFTRRIRKTLRHMTDGKVTGDLARDSRKNIFEWKNRLTPGEIDRVYEMTSDISKFFYPESDWDPEKTPSVQKRCTGPVIRKRGNILRRKRRSIKTH
jgi:hypothetical protein